MLYLTLMLDGVEQKTYALDKKDVTIGRGPENDVCINNLAVSKSHSRICFADLRLEDLGSANGTFVNGEKVQSRALENGDVIGIGKFEILFFHSKARPNGSPDDTTTWLVTPMPKRKS